MPMGDALHEVKQCIRLLMYINGSTMPLLHRLRIKVSLVHPSQTGLYNTDIRDRCGRHGSLLPSVHCFYSRGGDGAETLLSSCVPNLQLHLLPVDLHCPNLKIHANRGDVAT